MIKTLQIINFQSHKNTLLEFNPNVNVICGISDSGKTAVVRSLNSILKKNSFYIRKKEEDGLIKIEFDDCVIQRDYSSKKISKCPSCKEKISENISICSCGEVLTNQMSKDFYTVDGEKFEKFGVTLPDNILNKTKIFNIDFGDYSEFLNVCNQHSEMFFIGESYSGGVRNKILSALVPDSEKIDVLLKTLNLEIQKDTGEIEFLSDRVVFVENIELNSRIIIEKAQELNDKIESYKIKLSEYENKLNKLNIFKEKLIPINKILRCKEKVGAINPFIEKIKIKNIKYNDLVIKNNKLNNIRTLFNNFKRYDNFKKQEFKFIIKDIKALENNIVKLNNIRTYLKKVSKLNSFKKQDFIIINKDIKTYQDKIIKLNDFGRMFDMQKKNIDYSTQSLNKIKEELKIKATLCPVTGKEFCNGCKEIIGF